MRKQILLSVCAAAAMAGCGIDKEVYQAKVAELNKTQAELDQTKRDAAEARRKCDAEAKKLDGENAALKQRLVALGQNLSSLTTDMDAAKKRMAEMQKAQEQAEKRAAQFHSMYDKFRSMIDAGKLQVEVRNGLMLVKLPDNILFDPGRADLKPAGQEAIRQVTQILAGIEGRKFQVTGHTDNIPIRSSRFKSNWELSTQRAVEVVKFMSNNGMDPTRLSAAGYADTLPVEKNDNEDGRRKNRRIEIVLQPNIEDLPSMDDVTKPTA